LLLSDGQFLLEGEQSVVATQKEVTFGRACVMKKKRVSLQTKTPFQDHAAKWAPHSFQHLFAGHGISHLVSVVVYNRQSQP
jgi:hypothetical protein